MQTTVTDYFDPTREKIQIRVQTEFPDFKRNYEIRQKNKDEPSNFNYLSKSAFEVHCDGKMELMCREQIRRLLGRKSFNPNFSTKDTTESISLIDGKTYIIKEVR